MPPTPDVIDSERKDRVMEVAAQSHLDAIICSSPSAVLLLTGYWPVIGASVVVFTPDGEVHVVLPEDEVDLAGRTSGASFIPYQPSTLAALTSPIEALANPLRLLLTKLGLGKGTIGIEVDEGMQPFSYASCVHFRSSLADLLQQLAPEAHYKSCDSALEQMEARKTAKELEAMRRGSDIAAAGFEHATEAIQVGRREAEVAAAVQAAFQASTKAEGVERSYGFFFCMSGPNSATASAAYARTRQREIEAGDLVMIHANTCADGYWTDITRTYTAGAAPSDRQAAMRSAIFEARKAALGAIRPGVPACDVDRAARDVMRAHGFGDAFKHSTGHGVGFAAANANAQPRIHPRSPDVLEEGMTFNVEPAAYFDGYGGMRHCDVVAVTSESPTVFTEF
ncbi:MAG TPA: Xaa-Pro peptidase family protein [Candidatus Aquilonibacter sp.]|nr:Xaa-Pro peptidase family protein [Candidatus Aquilonibacter sp.]